MGAGRLLRPGYAREEVLPNWLNLDPPDPTLCCREAAELTAPLDALVRPLRALAHARDHTRLRAGDPAPRTRHCVPARRTPDRGVRRRPGRPGGGPGRARPVGRRDRPAAFALPTALAHTYADRLATIATATLDLPSWRGLTHIWAEQYWLNGPQVTPPSGRLTQLVDTAWAATPDPPTAQPARERPGRRRPVADSQLAAPLRAGLPQPRLNVMPPSAPAPQTHLASCRASEPPNQIVPAPSPRTYVFSADEVIVAR